MGMYRGGDIFPGTRMLPENVHRCRLEGFELRNEVGYHHSKNLWRRLCQAPVDSLVA